VNYATAALRDMIERSQHDTDAARERARRLLRWYGWDPGLLDPGP
jgi:hypothetical protein